MRLLKYFSIIALIFAIAFYIRQGQPRYRSFEGRVFGTFYHIKIRTAKKDSGLHQRIRDELALINAQMSVFDAESEISAINRAEAGHDIVLSDNMRELLRLAQTVYRQSGGAFDPTVGPLVDLWGFGPARPERQPSEEEIVQTLRHVGFDKLRFDRTFKTVRKTDGRVSLNLSAVAKGFGVDKVASLLEKEGYRNYIVEIGGEVRVSGFRDDSGTPWTLGVREPRENGANALTLDVTDCAVATSGDYQNYKTGADGSRYAHTISPQTGYPVKNALASVTVFADSCAAADAYATAMMSMGFEQAENFAAEHDISAVFFTRGADGGFVKSFSERAAGLLGE